MTQAKPHDIEDALRKTTHRQGQAADPGASVWVSANAGTGKTHVLTNRVLRLMLAGTAPERILCLTYTKAAAAEMSKRVFDKLAGWATAEHVALAHELATLIGAAPSGEMLARARVLFAHAIESPGGLKVQTIHAFCQSLLQRFPLEAGVPPGFSILDDAMARGLERDAIDGVLAAATSEPDGALAEALRTAVTYASDDRFDDMLRQALGHREWLEAVARHIPDDRDEDPLDSIERLYRRHFGVREAADAQAIEAEMAGLMPDAVLRRLVDALSGGSKTDADHAERLRPAIADAAGGERIAALRAFLLTGTGEPRKALMTKALREGHADLAQRASEAQGRFLALEAERRGLAVVTETMALTRLALAAMQRFSDAKARRAALDFDDLIERTVNLLGSGGNSADWVLFKLDGGLDHVLVDESQDTSPRQWQIVKALAGEFFADVGARAQVRTLFAVGDEKQSIYSFQGAAPKLFAAMGTQFAGQVKAAGLAWHDIPLQLSFRTVAPVLDAVDATFASPERTPGLGDTVGAIRHYARRAGQAGLVEIWPTETPDEADMSEAWSPLDERPVTVPATRLAQRIASTIRRWLDDKVVLASTGRAIRPGDILILVRKRNPFAGPMVAALKAARIPVAGADRIDIMNQIAVEDLVSLGNFLTLPEDDLALAEVLKSPIFGLDDDDLIAFAAKRQGTLWKALLDAAAANPRLGEARDLLRRWRREADFSPPYEFFASILDHDGIRRRLVSRLGAEAAEPIDQLLALAIRYDEESPPSLPGFLHWLSEAPREIKRDMEHGRDEVRVMTVHGAKGLEAPIVFLPDTCTTRSGMQAGGLVVLPDMRRPAGMPPPFCWPVKGTSSLAPIAAANAARQDDEAEERHRLLYVAMTRARDRLYVAGFEGAKGRGQGCWYDLIEAAIASGAAGAVETLAEDDGRQVRRISAPQAAPTEVEKTSLTAMHEAAAPPDWATRPAPREAVLSIPVAPSRLAPYDIDEEGEPKAPPRRIAPDLAEPPMLPPGPLAADNRFLRGTVTHALLQHLPGFAPEARAAAAEGFVAVRGEALPARARASVVKETLAILSHPDFAPLFGPGSRAEVPIVAELAPPTGRRGPALEVSGQIDRLVILPDSVLIVDYKTNRPPPTEVAGVAESYLLQLAAYRQALGAIYPGRRVRAALLWTDGPRLMEIPAAVLDAAEARLIDAVKA